MKNLLNTIILILILSNIINAQESTKTDPLLNYKHFLEVGLSLDLTRINTNHTMFNNELGKFEFIKNNYLPTFHSSINFGWLIKEKNSNKLWTIKTGLNFTSKNAELMDESNNKLNLSSGYIQIPLQFGLRIPLNNNKEKKKSFKAFELNWGVYASTPFSQRLSSIDNLDSKDDFIIANYIRYGAIGEIVFTNLNNKGQGNKFGIRFSKDFTRISKLKNSTTNLYPYYYSIGVFYNIANKYSGNRSKN